MRTLDILDGLVPIAPYNLIEVLGSVGMDAVVTQDDGIEVLADTKVIGQYLGVCRVIKPSSSLVSPGDLIFVWDTAIKPFELPAGLGKIYLTKDADIFLKYSGDASELIALLDHE